MSNELFNKDSNYKLEKVVFKSIITNSKALLHIQYKNIFIDHLSIYDVHLVGDKSDASIILFDSGEEEKVIDINVLNVYNVNCNGPLLKILGESNKVNINNSDISLINSFGPIIENLSKKVKMIIFLLLMLLLLLIIISLYIYYKNINFNFWFIYV